METFFPRGANYKNFLIVKCFHACKKYKVLFLEKEPDATGRFPCDCKPQYLSFFYPFFSPSLP